MAIFYAVQKQLHVSPVQGIQITLSYFKLTNECEVTMQEQITTPFFLKYFQQ